MLPSARARPFRVFLIIVPVVFVVLWFSFDELPFSTRWQDWAAPPSQALCPPTSPSVCSESSRLPSEYKLLEPLELELNRAASALDQLREETSVFDRRVEELVSHEAERCPYDAAIIYLVSGNRISELILSITLLLNNVALRCVYPIVLFHDGFFNDSQRQLTFRNKLLYMFLERLNVAYPSTTHWMEVLNAVEFVELKFELPAGLSHDINVVDPIFPQVWPGYHHMCNWYFADIFEHPRIRDMQYYLRLDSDSFILDTVSYDPIYRLHESGKKYGHLSEARDQAWVTVGLFALVQDYMDAHPEVEQRLQENHWEQPPRDTEAQNHFDAFAYFNNFEVVHIPSFRARDVRDWTLTLTSDPQRIYKYRWGDSPLRYTTIQMFFDVPHDVEQFCDILYYHQGLRTPACSYDDMSA